MEYTTERIYSLVYSKEFENLNPKEIREKINLIISEFRAELVEGVTNHVKSQIIQSINNL